MSNDFKVQMMDINEVQEYPNNPRQNANAIQKVVESINNVGWRVPIVVDEENVILAGHTRLKAAKAMNLTKVPVHIALDESGNPLSEDKKKAYRIMDNKSTEAASWDSKLLAEEFAYLADTGFDLIGTGFDNEEIERITKSLMEFDADEPEMEINDTDFTTLDDLETSNVRMVNLFLNQDNEMYFKEMCAALGERHQTQNMTETVFRVVEDAYGALDK